MITKFSEKFKEKSNTDLLYIIENPEAYQKEAVLTASYELESRGIVNETIVDVKNTYKQQEELISKIQLNSQKKRSSLPKSIANAVKLIYISMGLGVINPIIIELFLGFQSFSDPKSLVITLISTGVLALLAYQINLGENWARNVYTVLAGLGLMMSPAVIFETFQLGLVIGFLSLVQVALQGFAIFLLFKPESRTWYQSNKIKI
ncbi:hypothetical protein [uncultured Kordia sp.]|uniref:hypothetical protein n=1 Tax=uncultured Kordia sp. TaxID=507699 RepID=UPI00261BEF1B|nr:hypothetical protein [uncultured Kordia sp.]